jgi:hypothetical protein
MSEVDNLQELRDEIVNEDDRWRLLPRDFEYPVDVFLRVAPTFTVAGLWSV